jgi:hypothetical protein
MKNYVIYLPAYVKSTSMAQQALATGKNHGWDIELFTGIDGAVATLEDFRLTVNQSDAKCRDMLQRPGVQGCFLSHWQLWNRCVELAQPIGIFEHDVEFLGPCPNIEFDHVFKLEGFLKKKARPAGEWYEGARAYILHPQGADRLIQWVKAHGALPADVNIGLDVVDIMLDQTSCVQQHALYGKTDKRQNSFTWNLNTMEKI